ncbi:MAG TPA: FAD-binding oxidoreductase [Dehalococcoidia bacterium]|nr:FAD-binding oxidoreductase [Dehalococcoidia bacterium]
MTLAQSTETLAAGLRGDFIQAGDPEYDSARAVHNAMIDRRPRFIVRPVDTADVIAAVNFAREEGLILSVRGGGHSVPGFGTNDGGIVIDLKRMKGTRVDPQKRTVTAQGGCTWGDVNHATEPFGLHTPGGVVSTTGIGGLGLGGGIGHLTRPFGLVVDNIVSADVVLADGTSVVANENENPDLYWALRGGGGNFGVVTSFELRLHELPAVYAGPIVWPLEKTAEVMKFYAEFIDNAPDELNGIFAFLVVPPGDPFPEELHNKNMCAAVLCYTGPIDQGEMAVRPLAEFGPPAFKHLGPMPFPALQSIFDPIAPPGQFNYWKADFVSDLTAPIIEGHAKFGPGTPNIFSGVHIFATSGAAARVPKDATAWSYRDAKFSHVIHAQEWDASIEERHKKWVADYWNALHPHAAGGAYVNFMMDEGEDRIAASYRDNYPRLKETKRRYDPANLFRVNQNIKP